MESAHASSSSAGGNVDVATSPVQLSDAQMPYAVDDLYVHTGMHVKKAMDDFDVRYSNKREHASTSLTPIRPLPPREESTSPRRPARPLVGKGSSGKNNAGDDPPGAKTTMAKSNPFGR